MQRPETRPVLYAADADTVRPMLKPWDETQPTRSRMSHAETGSILYNCGTSASGHAPVAPRPGLA